MKRAVFFLLTAILLATNAYSAPPFMDFEGVGGAGIVPGAYRVNPPKEGQIFGKPSLSHWSLWGEGSNLYTHGVAISFLKWFEVGYVIETFDFARIRRQVARASNGKLDPGFHYIWMHDFHFKTLILNEKKYIPAFAITLEYKLNETIEDINKNLNGALDSLGYYGNDGIDFDFSISKKVDRIFYFPAIINANMRLTKGHYLGLLGFGKDYHANGEFSIAFLPFPKRAPNWGFGVEVRQQNDSFDHIPGLPGFTMKENAFWDVFIAGFWKRVSFAIAFCRFGNVVNTETDLFVFNFKYDF